MESSFFKFYKMILSKVSFNRALLYKESRKAMRYLPKKEKKLFLDWFKQHYYKSPSERNMSV